MESNALRIYLKKNFEIVWLLELSNKNGDGREQQIIILANTEIW
jgi:hypothetical protein